MLCNAFDDLETWKADTEFVGMFGRLEAVIHDLLMFTDWIEYSL